MEKSNYEVVDGEELEEVHKSLWNILDEACVYLLKNLREKDITSFTGKDKRVYTITVDKNI
tara:strand:+ start:435 stop:617 length:183 start_codon:yes stop_codon:yes gene_type:complete